MTLFIVTLSEHLYLEKFGLAFFFFFFLKTTTTCGYSLVLPGVHLLLCLLSVNTVVTFLLKPTVPTS